MLVFVEIAVNIRPAAGAPKRDGTALRAVREALDRSDCDAVARVMRYQLIVEEFARAFVALGHFGLPSAFYTDQKLDLWRGRAHPIVPFSWDEAQMAGGCDPV